MRIAVDVMGGDHGCGVVIQGIKLALEKEPGISVIYVVGNETEIKEAFSKCHLVDKRVEIVHASQVLTMEDKPVEGLRRKKDCSILRAVDLVKEGKAQAVISPGNTGGLVAASTIRLRPLPLVERPAIATVIPSETGAFVLIDAGANPECKAIHLLQFGIMGSVYSSEILGHKNPRVGILSNGKEEIKGNDLTKEALKLCRQTDLNFLGYVEGHDLFSGHVDVVVTDGFIGNIVLKTCESMGKAIGSILKKEFMANPVRMMGGLISKGALQSVKRRMDPEAHGGAPLLGVNGIVIKAHGSAKERAIMNAIRVSMQTVQHQINDLIAQKIAQAAQVLGGTENKQ